MDFNKIINIDEVDCAYNVYRYEKFKIDLETLNINKICMTEIVNADMMIATYGEEAYARGCREVLTVGRDAIRAMGLSDKLIHYAYNYKNFIVAGTDQISDEDFQELMYKTYKQFLHSSSTQVGLHALSRFVVAFGKEDLVNRAKSAFYLHRKSPINYIIASDEKNRIAEETKNNVGIFDLVNYAINNDTVIPYYQGIHNNKKGDIDKYEALMRIKDEEGNIHHPGTFLEVAKEFNLYSTISRRMIRKALEDFKDKDFELCLNISLLDVENEEFVKWFLRKLKTYPNTKNLTIEFVETENYNNGEKLYKFLTQVRDLGCKIAVDDFGAGFATFTSMISLKPDIIKVDGSIIKDLKNNADSRTILSTICYLSNLINAKIVAEFVETLDIQDVLIQESVDYSQGYLFGKPQPMEYLMVERLAVS